MTSEKLIEDIKGRIQFLVTIQILFIATMGELVTRRGDFPLGFGLTLCVFSYLLISAASKAKERIFDYIRWSLNLSLISVAVAMLLVLAVQEMSLSWHYLVSYIFFLQCTFYVPFITFVLVLIAFFNSQSIKFKV